MMRGFFDQIVQNWEILLFLTVVWLVAGGGVLYLLGRVETFQRRRLQNWVESSLKGEIDQLREQMSELQANTREMREHARIQHNEVLEKLNGFKALLTILRNQVEDTPDQVRRKLSKAGGNFSDTPASAEDSVESPSAKKSASFADAGRGLKFGRQLQEMPEPSRQLLETAQATARLLGKLKAEKADHGDLGRHLSSYCELAADLSSFRERLRRGSSSAETSTPPPEAHFQRIEAKANQLARDHSLLPFFRLLDDSAGRPALREDRSRLMELLEVEELEAKRGDLIGDEPIEVTSTSGAGGREIIEEVLARGYRIKGGEVVRPAKVTSRRMD